MADLFDSGEDHSGAAPRPLADRLRPATLGEVIGQEQVLGPDAPLGTMLNAGALGSIRTTGPHGDSQQLVDVASLNLLEKRVKERQIDVIPLPIQEAMAAAGPDIISALGEQLSQAVPWFYEHAYANDIYDLELDSSSMSIEDVCERIEARLAEGPGTAFAQLRKRHPRPF